MFWGSLISSVVLFYHYQSQKLQKPKPERQEIKQSALEIGETASLELFVLLENIMFYMESTQYTNKVMFYKSGILYHKVNEK